MSLKNTDFGGIWLHDRYIICILLNIENCPLFLTFQTHEYKNLSFGP